MTEEHAMEDRIADIVKDASQGKRLTLEDVKLLLAQDENSVSGKAVVEAAEKAGRHACDDTGLIFAQIGVDALPCPENCRFCAFAECNASSEDLAAQAGERVLPLDTIVELARIFDEAGVHMISLMASAALPLERYFEMVAAVRSAVSDDMPILANTKDLTLAEARALKDAGANAAYHALRLAEGRITDIAPDVRRATMRAIREADLALMTGIEPLWMGADQDELAHIIEEIPGFDPFCIGACTLTNAKGTAMETAEAAPTERVRYVAAVLRLVCGDVVPFGGVGGIRWVDAGADPRDRGYAADAAALRRQTKEARLSLEDAGWRVLGAPTTSILERGHRALASRRS